jgi:hypothetical protein
MAATIDPQRVLDEPDFERLAGISGESRALGVITGFDSGSAAICPLRRETDDGLREKIEKYRRQERPRATRSSAAAERPGRGSPPSWPTARAG